MSTVILKMHRNELAYIREIRLQAYEEHAPKIPEDIGILKTIHFIGCGFKPGIERMVAEIDGEIVGSVALFSPDIKAYEGILEEELDYPELRMLAISSKARGKGVATALINECIKRAKEKGFTSDGAPYRRFYGKCH